MASLHLLVSLPLCTVYNPQTCMMRSYKVLQITAAPLLNRNCMWARSSAKLMPRSSMLQEQTLLPCLGMQLLSKQRPAMLP